MSCTGAWIGQNPVPALIGPEPVGKEAEDAAQHEEDRSGNPTPNAPRDDQSAEDAPSRGQHDQRAKHPYHDADGHALAWHGSRTHRGAFHFEMSRCSVPYLATRKILGP